jgi:hypothetical protein
MPLASRSNIWLSAWFTIRRFLSATTSLDLRPFNGEKENPASRHDAAIAFTHTEFIDACWSTNFRTMGSIAIALEVATLRPPHVMSWIQFDARSDTDHSPPLFAIVTCMVQPSHVHSHVQYLELLFFHLIVLFCALTISFTYGGRERASEWVREGGREGGREGDSKWVSEWVSEWGREFTWFRTSSLELGSNPHVMSWIQFDACSDTDHSPPLFDIVTCMVQPSHVHSHVQYLGLLFFNLIVLFCALTISFT